MSTPGKCQSPQDTPNSSLNRKGRKCGQAASKSTAMTRTNVIRSQRTQDNHTSKLFRLLRHVTLGGALQPWWLGGQNGVFLGLPLPCAVGLEWGTVVPCPKGSLERPSAVSRSSKRGFHARMCGYAGADGPGLKKNMNHKLRATYPRIGAQKTTSTQGSVT